MSVRNTSKKAYKEINEDGTDYSQYDHIMIIVNSLQSNYKGWGMSLREISKFSGIEINAVSGRVNELKKQKKLHEMPRRKCSITKRLITPVSSVTEDEWRVLNNPDDGSWKGR